MDHAPPAFPAATRLASVSKRLPSTWLQPHPPPRPDPRAPPRRFGPAGDPRGAGIGTPEAIQLVWSCHREIISDVGPVPTGPLTQS